MRWTELIRRARRSRSPESSDLGQWIEAALLVMLLIQFARLLWALVTPVGLYGDWRAREPVVVSADARKALFAGFDPFFRAGVAAGAGEGGAQQVTSLPLQLFGISLNEASGGGSAIIASEGGEQTSYAVGDEIAPGVTLKSVQFDHVVIERGGVTETLYIDQSGGDGSGDAAGAPDGGAPADNAAQPGPGGGAGALTPEGILGAVSMVPRSENGRVTGIVVGAQGDAGILSRAGFRPGDIIVQVSGQPVRSAGDIQALQESLRPGARLSLMVERGSATVPISLILPENR
ncbi:putative general secretion pathway protein C [Sphingobium sp. SYK-6]|uniref:type II secretion system protein N n=1 Tax=Sphingobium sp. (strain NBRC 103272 / SYK-6) TaxID=627192 RepID=UPI000227744B|nr:type II secretion system protein N [Sphingobium sp. SYK-6]BAK66049.1 putative general secretion pathway protein C [Sphingobium sp. SYK-6]